MSLDQNNREIPDINIEDIVKGMQSQVNQIKNSANKAEAKLLSFINISQELKKILDNAMKPIIDELKIGNDLNKELLKNSVDLKNSIKNRKGEVKDKGNEVKDLGKVTKSLGKEIGKQRSLTSKLLSWLMKKDKTDSASRRKIDSSKATVNIDEKSISKFVKELRKRHRKGDTAGVEDLVSNFGDKVKSKKTKVEKTQKIISELQSITKVIDSIAPHNIGIGTRVDLAARFREANEANNQMQEDLHRTLQQTMGSRGSLLPPGTAPFAGNYRQENNPQIIRFLTDLKNLQDDVLHIQQTTIKKNAVWLANLRNGVRLSTQLNALSRQGLQLGTLINVDAEQTSEEIREWNLQLGLSIQQTASVSHNMVSISHLTGITGDKLLTAARSARQYAEAMRDAGTLTGESLRNLTQLSAVSGRMGTENIIAPIRQALQGSNQFFESSPEIMSYLMSSAESSNNAAEVINALQTGTINNNPRLLMDLARGQRQRALAMSGGLTMDQLRRPENSQALMAANINARRTHGFSGINAMFLAADTMEQGSENFTEQISRLRRQLAQGNLTLQDRIDLETQIGQLEKNRVRNEGREASSRLGNITYTNEVPNMPLADIRNNINSVMEALSEAARELSGPGADTERARLAPILAGFRNRAGGELDATTLQNLVRDMQTELGNVTTFEQGTQGSIVQAQRWAQEATMQLIERQFLNLSELAQRNMPEMASQINVGVGIAQAILDVSKGILNGISGIVTSLGNIALVLGASRGIGGGVGGIGDMIGGIRGAIPEIIGGVLMTVRSGFSLALRAMPWAALAYELYELFGVSKDLVEAFGRLNVTTENTNRLTTQQQQDRQNHIDAINRGQHNNEFVNDVNQGHGILRDLDLAREIEANRNRSTDIIAQTEMSEQEIASGTRNTNPWLDWGSRILSPAAALFREGQNRLSEPDFQRQRGNVLGARANQAALEAERNRRNSIWNQQLLAGTNLDANNPEIAALLNQYSNSTGNESTNINQRFRERFGINLAERWNRLDQSSILNDLPQILELVNDSQNNQGALSALSRLGVNYQDLRTRNPNATNEELANMIRTNNPNLQNALPATPALPTAPILEEHENRNRPGNQSQTFIRTPNNQRGLFDLNPTAYRNDAWFGMGGTIPGFNYTPNGIQGNANGIGTPTSTLTNDQLIRTIAQRTGQSEARVRELMEQGTISAVPNTATPTTQPTGLNAYANSQQAADRNLGNIDNNTGQTAEEMVRIRELMDRLVINTTPVRTNPSSQASNSVPNFYSWNQAIT